MAKPTGFMEHDRKEPPKRPVEERVLDYEEIEQLMSQDELETQACRCMDCGIPFCHAFGCPLANLMPEWQDLVYRGKWQEALELLHSTNNFPEITGRICPALCEAACTLGINRDPVAIRHIELQLAERGWREGWIHPEPPDEKTGLKVAVIGSGPAGLAAAQQLARAGHDVVVYDKADRAGGILRYGIPDFKLAKSVLDRRLGQMEAEGVRFETSVNIGKDIAASYLAKSFDAVLLTMGARAPRDLSVPGRELNGVHFALEFLTQQNRRNAGDTITADREVLATDKDVVVIGGGDTGSDCVGTSRRQGAASITQIELLPKPPEGRLPESPWPTWPMILRTSTSHQEGCERLWSVLTKEVLGEDGRVTGLRCVRLEWSEPDESGRRAFTELEGSEFTLPAELVLLAMGFVHVEHGSIVEQFGLETDARGNLKIDEAFMTPISGVFAAGDTVKGASLVVHAIALGRKAAECIDGYLRSGASLRSDGAAASIEPA
jgi:NAD(P)H-dependent glutamate synthase small subunit